ncbi:MAG: P-II family nitrogen regulator [Thaumarchaeota archaeon]|nr:P-II family nitrogen regulator [Nitrososphaerota archaeon]
MKKIEAAIRKDRFPEVDIALRRIGVGGITIAEERTPTQLLAADSRYWGVWSYPTDLIPHVILTVVVDDDGAKRVVDSIVESSSSRNLGDGKIVVSQIEGVYDIGSRETDRSALTPTLNA